MSGNRCCVKNCNQFSHDEDGKSLNNGLTFFSFPAWRTNEGDEICELTMRRRAAWVAAVSCSNITFSHIPKSSRVCSRHFHSGKPAYERLQSDPDWAPSLDLGHDEGRGRYTDHLHLSIIDKESKKKRKKEKILKKEKDLKRTVKKKRFETPRPPMGEAQSAVAAGVKKAVGGPVKDTRNWSEARSLLLSVMKSERISNQTKEKTVQVRTETDLRDFFRKSLEESLENFSKSRSLSTQEPPIYVELKENLSLRILPVKKTGKEPSSSSTLSCGNCVRLQRKVIELQEELSHLTGQEETSNWAAPLEGALIKRRKLSASSRKLTDTDKDKPRPTPRFRKAWLRMFEFLRYSPSLNIMWCHICRLYHDKKHQDNGMIKGSRCLKLDNIKSHSTSIYHKENMERYMKHMSNLNPSDSNYLNGSSEENI